MEGIYGLARAFLSIESMTNKKLQKLCYYAKAWYLALYDENLIEDDFEAWVHGPVCPKLYDTYKIYGFEYIPQEICTDEIPEEFLEFSKEVYEAYGDLTGNELESLTHTEEPWLSAREGYKPWQRCNCVIDENIMKAFYRGKIGA